MDDMDIAQGINETHLADSLAAVRRSAAQDTNNLTNDCVDCGEEIPAARRKAQPGCRRCRDCQELHEHWRPV